ncbi:MAG TPA: c-type cytochrome [Terriglobales bacterium]|nr:c-type cytochrome [Terriglobales bacterium]
MVCKSRSLLVAILLLAGALFLFATSNGAWMAKVPPRDHDKINPYRDQPEAIAAGRRVFLEHCAQCHGKNAEGTKKRPSLRTARVQQEATEGDLHWLLENGSMRYGMPSWSQLGDAQIWQVITYVRSLHQAPAKR